MQPDFGIGNPGRSATVFSFLPHSDRNDQLTNLKLHDLRVPFHPQDAAEAVASLSEKLE
jgi:hypothetical protein